MEEVMSYFTKLSEDERIQELAYDEFRKKMDYRLYKQAWRKKGFEQGRQEGLQEGMQKIALNLLKEKTDIAFISKITGFSKEEIKKLKKNS